ncbi:IS66 family insertion sequence hypothetical protein (plasmid) [Ralstonia solanacearum]|nr:Mobile element protein [Ralstonia pseudosolanacearum FQY_4]AXV99250.1 IS66 family insertion sequence hypothetical protein [Ralstonia solanacearum]AXV99270.1 IS66 family insertion sequence hypothetical protein [Ralstonia solanacearum]AXW55964.1 IS66 family insertion sequence hypothetical protein [Ralstonia solanacearum]AXW56614.1 IS66 family insertion sequence hypothetical protein [Ralstonia solanacearum]
MQGARRGAGQGDDRSTGGEVTFHFDEGLKVYLHRDAVDFRKSINGLAVLVEQAMGLDPFAAAVYVFRNRRADRIKILGWDRNGFWLLFKRLEQDRFAWPRQAAVATLSVEQLHWLLQGIDIEAMQRHPRRAYHRAA